MSPVPETLPSTVPFEQLGNEALGFWTSVADLWLTYIEDLAKAPGPEGMLRANTRLLAGGMSLGGSATNAVMRRGGVTRPLLNDA